MIIMANLLFAISLFKVRIVGFFHEKHHDQEEDHLLFKVNY